MFPTTGEPTGGDGSPTHAPDLRRHRGTSAQFSIVEPLSVRRESQRIKAHAVKLWDDNVNGRDSIHQFPDPQALQREAYP